MLMKLDRRGFRALRVFFDPVRLRALTRRSEVGLSLAEMVAQSACDAIAEKSRRLE
ncbi:hypothetical protein AB9E28_34750 [Rhizobium leguminosarum]|uniref:hypothetical protein n=1 Tax=Rhizobium leguminosarum TaxID=384 RepID=UPI003F9E94E4